MDKEGKKLTVIGDIDPVSIDCIVSKLRKLCHTEIVSVGPANEPEGKKKKDDDETKKDDEKKEIEATAYGAYNVLGAANACVIF